MVYGVTYSTFRIQNYRNPTITDLSTQMAVVTKINWIGNFRIIIQPIKVAVGFYNPK